MPTLKDLFYSASDGVFAIDRKQRIIYWDAGCEELFGHSSNWVLGRPCCDVMQGCHPVSEKEMCSKDCCVAALSTGTGNAPKTFQLNIKNAAGKQIMVTVNVVLIPSECKGDWIVTHFLHREKSTSVLKSLEYAQTKHIMPSQVAANSASAFNQESQPKNRLTPREQEILLLLAEGLTCPSISTRLSVSQTTVRNHIQHILSKLCVHSRTEAVAYAYRHELI
ncbi:LuxR C-terminal-related transcriptional regulator [Kaarinaea lacus]